MNFNRLLSQISTNKLLSKNLLFTLNGSLTNSLLKTSATLNNQLQNDYFKCKQFKSHMIHNSRLYSDAAADKTLPKSAMPEMEKSLTQMEKTLHDNILTRQANFKLKHLSYLEEAEKKPPPPSNKTYDNYIDPYVKLFRFHNLSPVHLVYWPSAWAIIGSASYLHTTPDFYMLGLFAIGALAMRTSGCIINDIWDRNIDKHVERVSF